MKTMIYSFLMAAAAVMPLIGCSDNDAVVEQRDWSTTTLFASSDVAAQDIYYKPQSGFRGTNPAAWVCPSRPELADRCTRCAER